MKVLICDLKGEALNYALALALDESPFVNEAGEVYRTFLDGGTWSWKPTEDLVSILDLLSAEGYDLEDLFEHGLWYNGTIWEADQGGGGVYVSEALTDLIAQQWIRHITGKDKIMIKRKVLAQLGHVFEHEVTQIRIINVYGPAGCGKSSKMLEMVEKFGCYGVCDDASTQMLEFEGIEWASEQQGKPLLVISQEPIAVPQGMGVIYHDFRTLEFYNPEPDATIKEMFKDAVPLFTLVVNAPEVLEQGVYDKLNALYGPYWAPYNRVVELTSSEFRTVCEFFQHRMVVITTEEACHPVLPSTRIEWDEFVKDLK